MDIRSNEPNPRRRFAAANDTSDPRVAAHRMKQARIDGANQPASSEVGPNAAERRENAALDRIDLSESARAAARVDSEGGTPPDRLAALRELYQSGRLNSPDRIERAASAILGKPVDPAG